MRQFERLLLSRLLPSFAANRRRRIIVSMFFSLLDSLLSPFSSEGRTVDMITADEG